MIDMHFDPEFHDLLVSLNLASALQNSSFKVLNNEACAVCDENTPGNFILLPGGDAASALLMAWIIRKCTAYPRVLFVPGEILEKYAEQFAQIGRGWVKPVDGLLQEAGDARNWLGMIALIHAGSTPVQCPETDIIRLLAGQLMDKARVIFDEAVGITEPCRTVAVLESEVIENNLVLRWHGMSEPNHDLPAELIQQFREDDPTVCGIPTLMSDNERFHLYYVARCLLPLQSKPVRFVEIGSFAGGSFYLICKALQRLELAFQGIAVEPFEGDNLAKVMSFFQDNAIHLPMFSHEAVSRLKLLFDTARLPELILIDGDHSYEAVCRDIQDYYPLLAPGGIMLFHDYLPPVSERNRAFITDRKAGDGPGIGEACRELMEQQLGLEPIDLPLLYPTCLAQTLASQAIIPEVFSTVRAYRKPSA